MGVIIFLILFSLIVALIFLVAFFWAVKSGQFNDTHTPSIRMLYDNDNPTNKNKSITKNRDV